MPRTTTRSRVVAFRVHSHHDVEFDRHRSVVTVPDGIRLTAVSFDERDPYARARPPDYGLYLDARWQPPWPHEHLTWPDFRVPPDKGLVIATLRSLVARLRAGEHVELGGLGGHRRTRTALAILAVLSGLPADESIEEAAISAVATKGRCETC